MDRWLVETLHKGQDGRDHVYQRTMWPTREMAEGNVHVMRLVGWERHGYVLRVVDGETAAPADRVPFLPVCWAVLAAQHAARQKAERAKRSAKRKAKSAKVR